MENLSLTTIVVIAVIALVLIGLVAIYNGLIRSQVRTQEAWSGISIQLKRRADLVPNLVEVVRGYAAHERGTLEEVARARGGLQAAGGAGAAAAANQLLTQALGRLYAVIENYPQLQAAGNFKALQEELTDIEEKIAYARQFYNRNVMSFNRRIQRIPDVVVARILALQPFEFFQAEEATREPPKVSFPTPAAPTAPTSSAPPAV